MLECKVHESVEVHHETNQQRSEGVRIVEGDFLCEEPLLYPHEKGLILAARIQIQRGIFSETSAPS